MSKFKQYRRTQIAELRPVTENDIEVYHKHAGELIVMNKKRVVKVSISVEDLANGSPKIGDMIARNPKNHDDQWLVAEQYFKDNFEPIVHNVNNKYSKNMKSTKLQRDILRWEYENETKDMYSPPSPIEWLENKLIELRKHAVVGQSEQLACDNCGCHPNVIYTTSKGRFCERCKPAN